MSMAGFMNSKPARIASLGSGYDNPALHMTKSISSIKRPGIVSSGSHGAMSAHNQITNHRFSNHMITKDTWMANQI